MVLISIKCCHYVHISFISRCVRFLKLKEALKMFFTRECTEYALTEEEWTLIEELVEVLKPLFLATQELSGEKFTSISKVIPLTQSLLDIYYDEQYANPDKVDEPLAYSVSRVLTEKVGFCVKPKRIRHVLTELQQEIGSH